jgi:hypothetical protein
VSGYTKRAFAGSCIAVSYSIGNIIGPQSFQARDAPEYTLAKIVVLGTQAGCVVVMCVLATYYVWGEQETR